MLWVLTKKQQKEHEKELIKFCKENHCLMYNYMNTIKNIRNEPQEKILHKKLKKQARKYWEEKK